MPGLRVVLDTNVLVSGLAYPSSIPGRIVAAWRQGSIEVVLSRFILEELVRVLPRLTRIQMSPSEVRELADTFLFMAEIVEPVAEAEPGLRDDADQAVLGTLKAAQAAYLITGDRDLLVWAEKYPIVTPAVFWERHGQ
jgi:putative PIN family toxin of toxin-antitoxin system